MSIYLTLVLTVANSSCLFGLTKSITLNRTAGLRARNAETTTQEFWQTRKLRSVSFYVVNFVLANRFELHGEVW